MTRSIASDSAIASFFRNLPDTIQQPAAIAMFGSLGAHLLFFATLPAFTPAESDNPDREIRRVQVIELPKNESRTVDALRSSLGLPPLPNIQNPKVQPGQSSTIFPPNPLYSIPNLDQPSSSAQQNWSQILEMARRQQRSILVPKTNPPPPPPKPQTRPSQPPQSDSPRIGQQFKPEESRVETPTEFEAPAAGNQEQPPATTPPKTAQNDQLLAATRYNPEGTDSREVQTTGLGNWFKGLADRGVTEEPELIRVRKQDDPTLAKPIPELPYPLSFALNNYKQHPAVVLVLVDKDGKPIGKPEILGSTGYGILNEAAIAAVEKKAGDYQPSDRVRVYMYEFQFAAPASPNTASAPPTGN